MSAHTIFDNAPIGSIIAWSDGTPQLPARFRKKLAARQSSNSRGRLIRKQGGRGVGNVSLSPKLSHRSVSVSFSEWLFVGKVCSILTDGSARSLRS